MDFVNPALLGGIALAALPIVLHLVMRQKPKRLEFPALRFVRRRKKANQRRMRFQHWLLLALRVGAVCLLALALARPSFRAQGNGGGAQGPIAAALVFDTAPRMGYRHENQTRIEVAQQIARDLLTDFPADTRVAVLDTRGQPAVFQIDLSSAEQRIDRLEVTPAAQPIGPALDEALRLLDSSERPRREIYIFTDMSAAAWSLDSSGALAKRLDKIRGLGVYLVDVGVVDPQNCSLGELRLSSQVLSQSSPVVVSTDVSCRGNNRERVVVLEMQDADGKPQKRSEATYQLLTGQPQQVEFTLGALPLGTHQGQLHILGTDGLASDDTRYFTVDVQPSWKVLIVAGRPTSSTAGYLSEALAPEKFRKQGIARLDCDVIAHEELDSAELRNYSALFVLDPPPLSSRGWQKLSDFAQSGGGVAVFVGEHAAPAETFNLGGAGVMPAPLTKPHASRTQLSTSRVDHPVLRKFKPLNDQVPWDAFPVYRYWELGDLVEGDTTVLNFADGSPALIERPVGRGRIMLFTSSISDPPGTQPTPWNRLLTGLRPWPFFMLSNELALYLVGSSDNQLNYVSGQPATIRMRRDQRVVNYLLSTPRDEHIKGTVAGKHDSITIAADETPGHYRVRSGGDRGFDAGFSANLSPLSTSLERLKVEELKRVFGEHAYRVAHNVEEMQRQVSSGRVGSELFPLLIIVVAVVMGLEQVVANRFYRQEQK